MFTALFAAISVANAATYDIAALGAKNDGTTDNTEIIQQAIDDCSAS